MNRKKERPTSINWAKLKTENPKAWEAFVGPKGSQRIACDAFDSTPSSYCEGVPGKEDNDKFTLRDLYEFFDEKGLHACVFYDDENNPEAIDFKMFGFRIIEMKQPDDMVMLREADDQFEDRKQAEVYMFIECFECLEEDLAA